MSDGTFKYCNHLECGAMIQGVLPEKSSSTEPVLRAAIDHDVYTVDRVDQVLFAFDQTCNLSCPSCRRDKITEKPSLNLAKAKAVEEKLLPLLRNLKTLNINPAEELFASKPSRRLLKLINRETCPDLKIDIISNGTLFTEKEWNKYPGIHDMIRSIRISVDAATKETFETLRRLGNFDVFCRNMQFLANLRQEDVIPRLTFSFTYQLGNFREMVDFVHFARGFNCDFVIFERLQDLGAFTHQEYLERAVHQSDHPLHLEFRAIISPHIRREIRVA